MGERDILMRREPIMEDKKLLRLTTLAKRWDVSVKTLRRAIWSGQLKAVRMGKLVLVPVEEAERYRRSLPAA